MQHVTQYVEQKSAARNKRRFNYPATNPRITTGTFWARTPRITTGTFLFLSEKMLWTGLNVCILYLYRYLDLLQMFSHCQMSDSWWSARNQDWGLPCICSPSQTPYRHSLHPTAQLTPGTRTTLAARLGTTAITTHPHSTPSPSFSPIKTKTSGSLCAAFELKTSR